MHFIQKLSTITLGDDA